MGVVGLLAYCFAVAYFAVGKTGSHARVASASVLPAAESYAGVESVGGWWSTNGGIIVDHSGQEVRFSGMNWHGFDSENMVAHGFAQRNYQDILDQMVNLGFNFIRLPFSSAIFAEGAMPLMIDYTLNPDLQGLTVLEVMDKFVDAASIRGMKILLDYHRLQPGSASEWGFWYPQRSPADYIVSNWQILVARYANDTTVVAVDIFNEPHSGGTDHPGTPYWSSADNDLEFNWRAFAKLCGDSIHEINPNLLIFVQGLDVYNKQTFFWAGDLHAVRDAPLVLAVPNKLVYEIHEYGPSIYFQTWFQDPTFPANMPGRYTDGWGYLIDGGHAPVVIGEVGTKLDPSLHYDLEVEWLDMALAYFRYAGVSWIWWAWPPLSGDTGGMLADDWVTIEQAKMDIVTASGVLWSSADNSAILAKLAAFPPGWGLSSTTSLNASTDNATASPVTATTSPSSVTAGSTAVKVAATTGVCDPQDKRCLALVAQVLISSGLVTTGDATVVSVGGSRTPAATQLIPTATVPSIFASSIVNSTNLAYAASADLITVGLSTKKKSVLNNDIVSLSIGVGVSVLVTFAWLAAVKHMGSG